MTRASLSTVSLTVKPPEVDPDDELLVPKSKTRPCGAARLIEQLTPERAAKVAEAVALGSSKVPRTKIAEYVLRKTGSDIHVSTFHEHWRGVCSCPR